MRANTSKYAFIIALVALARSFTEPYQSLLSSVALLYAILELVIYPALSLQKRRQQDNVEPEPPKTLGQYFNEQGFTDNN